MKSKALLRSAVAVIALSALPAAAVAQLKIIAVQARVDGTTYGVAPNSEQVPVSSGDRVRVELVGTSIEGGRGVERPVNARFNVAAGRGALDIVQTGSNWVVVNVRGGDNETAQLGYSVTGGYDMRGSLSSGRITFQINSGRRGNNSHDNDGRGGYGRRDDDRWNRARELNRMLYRGILNENPRGNDDRREDIDRIYKDGSLGLRAVALDLAREAERDIPSRLSQDEAVRIVGDLYRGLLGRSMSDRELWDRDRGFRGNVDTLRRSGLERLVDVIVGSEEFRSVNRTVEFDRMPRDRGRRY
jgi:opacity protein-like surface antigen